MGMKDKDIVENIVDKLREMEDRPYKEGAWESFKSHKSVGYTRRRTIWYAAASILLCFGIGTGLWMLDKDSGMENETMRVAEETNLKPAVEQQMEDNSRDVPSSSEPKKEVEIDNVSLAALGEEPIASLHSGLEPLNQRMELHIQETVSIPKLAMISGRGPALGTTALPEEVVIENKSPRLENHYLAQTGAQQTGVLALKSPEEQQARNRVVLSDRFELGLFVSPYATSNQMKVGGGLALSYKLHKNLSLRTGASYNSYEIQNIKNPIEASSTEIVPAANADVSLLSNSAMTDAAHQRQMIIPNINAITGFVKSVDIPLEVKVNDNANAFYATAGLAYSAIFNQERQAHYVENLNRETFADGYPENKQQAEAAVKPLTRTIESAEENVNSKGFNGFVNFSVGRNIRVNQKVGISIEPYLKVPVGQYRRADMDYTNGGIRVMTNF